jgi:predicted transcriptional regulator
MDMLTENPALDCFVPPPFRVFSGFVPEPTVKKGQGSPVRETDINDNDVLLGRGKSRYSHNGNMQFRYVVLRVATENCDKIFVRNEKTFESSKVVAIIRNLEPPGRFLSQNDKTGCWEEVGDITARKKVAQAFRDYHYAAIQKVKEESNMELKGLNHSQTDEVTLGEKDLQANNEIVNCENASYPRFSNRDVLLGRGNCKHPGNVKLRQLVAVNLTAYYQHPQKKAYLVDKIIREMRSASPPSRFFYQNTKKGIWGEAGVHVIRKKVAQKFRDFHNANARKVYAETYVNSNATGHFQTNKVHRTPEIVTNTSKTCKQVLTNNKGSQCLSKNDILLGRGRSKHFGNVMLRHLVTKNLITYYNEPCKKALLISEIMGVIKNLNPPGRFMSQNTKTGVWEEVGDITSQQKLAQAFRDCRYAAIRKSNA